MTDFMAGCVTIWRGGGSAALYSAGDGDRNRNRQQVLAAEAFLPPNGRWLKTGALSRVTVKGDETAGGEGLILRRQGVSIPWRCTLAIPSIGQRFHRSSARHGSSVGNRWLLRTRVGAPNRGDAGADGRG